MVYVAVAAERAKSAASGSAVAGNALTEAEKARRAARPAIERLQGSDK